MEDLRIQRILGLSEYDILERVTGSVRCSHVVAEATFGANENGFVVKLKSRHCSRSGTASRS
jgi:hypothetical protein